MGALAIDIPIGIPEAGARPADREARALLGPRRNSVFPAPVRAAGPAGLAAWRAPAAKLVR